MNSTEKTVNFDFPCRYYLDNVAVRLLKLLKCLSKPCALFGSPSSR